MSTVQFAGFSRVAGALKFRTANEISRAQQLAKLGDTDISMAILPNPMTKNDAAKYVLTNLAVSYPRFNTPEATGLLTGLIKDENPFAKPKKAAKPRTVKVKSTKPRLIIGSVSVGADDAPYTPKQAAKIRAEFMKKLKVAYEAN
jgi:hypothetical protein